MGARITSVYALALAVAVFLQFDRVAPWLSGVFEESAPRAVTALSGAVEAAHGALGLSDLGLKLDCSTAVLFEGTYKKTYRCRQGALAVIDAPMPAPGAADRPVDAPLLPREAAEARDPGQEKIHPPMDVLVVGDSLAVTLAASLERVFKEYEGLNLISKGKIASGLQNPQYYNWEQALRQFLDEHRPQVVVVMMGANDAKYLALDPESPEPAALADRRRAIYEARLKKFLAVMDEKGVASYWIGLPVMGDEELSRRGKALNDLVSQAARASARCRFVDTWDLLAGPGGAYAQHILLEGRKVRVREGDKVHFSAAGGEILARAFLRDAGEAVELRPRESRQVAQAPGKDLPQVR